MRIDEALQQIDAMSALAERSTVYQGLRSVPIALTGLFGLAAGVIQPWWMSHASDRAFAFVDLWVIVAVAALAIIFSDMAMRYYQSPTARARRLTLTVLKRLSPAIVVGGGLTLVLCETAPETIWMLPGLWALMLGLGIYSTAPYLPRPLQSIGIWYLGMGMATLMLARDSYALSPWSMAIPFGGGQLLTAWLIYRHPQHSTE
ncbi:hypothetical protein [Stieleria varia]|uniref:Uncharacterized protein n=1 Tax=Stieleria varia TaxID=2528005 RepID=A0A5C6AJY6_9BACT|nr:hypothetical protein [Stieleria varia]TWT98513.1 hypothetical protein Pla52n_50270 [Stieleria varia]